MGGGQLKPQFIHFGLPSRQMLDHRSTSPQWLAMGRADWRARAMLMTNPDITTPQIIDALPPRP
jgi:hypothetical protein